MKNIAVIPNITKDQAYQYTRQLVDIFLPHANIFMSSEHASLGGDIRFVDYVNLFDNIDVAIALGGDGTLLSVAADVSRLNIPIMGVNIGHLGFLAEVEPANMVNCYKRFFEGDYNIENRIMLQSDIIHNGVCVKSFHALNDIVVSRASFSRLLNLKILIDGHLLDSFFSDGVILSTPTGSTAYSLSAGGPILDPSLEVILSTPICPHTMHARSMVLPLHKEILVELGAYGATESMVTADGRNGCSVVEGDTVVVKKSPYITKLIKITDTTFYDTVRQKLSERGV